MSFIDCKREKMEVIIGKSAGFCYGVKRAVEGAYKEIENKKESKVYCFGEIVHNKNVIDELSEKGIEFIDNIEENQGRIIIRAHGIEKSIYEKAKELNIKIIDLTCPKVMQIHNIIKEFVEKEFFIFLCGKKNHPETIGNYSYCGEKSCIIEDEKDIDKAIEKFEQSNMENALLISQTTYNKEKFNNVKKKIESTGKNMKVVVKDTICTATKMRQDETFKIAKVVDAMIIIGGKNSSNTKELYTISKEICESTYLVENSKEINLDNLKGKVKIGIMAGASTPQYSIDEVVKILKESEKTIDNLM